MEHLEKPSEDGSEVIFTQPGEGDGATAFRGAPLAYVLDRRKENFQYWSRAPIDKEPYHGAGIRTEDDGS